ncbi:aldose epimerase family protein [Streptomyces sp. GSL17-111]|uniref:aldose epimerase family protein n=1 Tax=Streptomyces sp. GSL17-111 TaxID=3121596 RepID=UPI0030F486AF
MTEDGVGEEFGTDPRGVPVHRYTLRAGGISAGVLTYGGVVQCLQVPDVSGTPGNVVIGLDSMKDYLTRSRFFGSVIGRYGNRIADAAFTLDGLEYRLPRNHGRNSLHGGPEGFHARVWRVVEATPDHLTLSHRSPDGDAGYPGTLDVTLRYGVSASETHTDLRLDYHAVTDAPTHVNLTNHSYFNLAGHGGVEDHRLVVDAEYFLPVDEEFIPTGEFAPVAGTPFDLSNPGPLGERLAQDHPQLRIAGGFDHCYVLRTPAGSLRPVARLGEPGSGRTMEVLTTEPGLQCYSGHRLGDAEFGPGSGLCLETQHFPDSPNRPSFPTTVLRPGQEYRSTTVYRFGTDLGQQRAADTKGVGLWR